MNSVLATPCDSEFITAREQNVKGARTEYHVTANEAITLKITPEDFKAPIGTDFKTPFEHADGFLKQQGEVDIAALNLFRNPVFYFLIRRVLLTHVLGSGLLFAVRCR